MDRLTLQTGSFIEIRKHVMTKENGKYNNIDVVLKTKTTVHTKKGHMLTQLMINMDINNLKNDLKSEFLETVWMH